MKRAALLIEVGVMTILSISRRTDVPAFYLDWLMERVELGMAYSKNPFNGAVKEVSLQPQDVSAMVFWSKDYRRAIPVMENLRERGYELFFHYTITGLGPIYEPHVPSIEAGVENFRALASRFPGRVWWRFDPILIAEGAGWQDHEERFLRLAGELEGYTDRCTISFVQLYPKVSRRMAPLEKSWQPQAISLTQRQEFVQRLADLGRAKGIGLYACCNEELVGGLVQQAHCIDAGWMGLTAGRLIPDKKNPTRKGCGCSHSVDIGMYDTCIHGCLYCYANRSHQGALVNFRRHKPTQPLITGNS